jgi:hypothetical protein
MTGTHTHIPLPSVRAENQSSAPVPARAMRQDSHLTKRIQSEAWETEDLQVMRSLPKTGGLDCQAGVPRVAYRFSTTRNPASISFNDPTLRESTWQV